MGWKPITITDKQVVGAVPSAEELLEIALGLSACPPAEWGQIFNERRGGVELRFGLCKPTVSGDTITLRVEDREIEDGVTYADDMVDGTNQIYEDEAIPAEEAEEAREAVAARAAQDRIDDAQGRLDALV